MRITSLLTIFAVIVAVTGIVATHGEAEAQGVGERLNVVVIDRQSLSGDPGSEDLVESLVGLLLHLREGQAFAYLFADDPSTVYGPLDSDADGFRDLHSKVVEVLGTPPPIATMDLSATLAETYNYLVGLHVGPETMIYVVTGAHGPTAGQGYGTDRLGTVAALIESVGWSVFSITTPETDAGLRSALNGISAKTDGRSFDLSIPDGLTEMSDWMLRQEGRGSLDPIGETELSAQSVWESVLDVAPGTGHLNMVFFRDDPITSFKLRNPDGFETSAGDRASSTLTEYPHVVLWELVNPVPGQWRLDVSGNSGTLVANRYASNRYGIELQSLGAVPVGEPMSIVAAVLDGDQPVALDVLVTARVTAPDGTTLIYNLNDGGTGGDSVAADGYFSATVPPVASEGNYEVYLALSWPGIDYTITTKSSFEAAQFPTVLVTAEELDVIQLGVRTKIATLMVHIAGQPFSVPAETLAPSVVTNQGTPGVIDIVPRQLISAGEAYEYDLFYTPEDESLATVVVTLGVEYAGRMFSSATDPQVVSSILPVPPPPPAPAPAAPAPAPATPQREAPVQPEVSSGIPMALIVVLGVIGAAILGLLVYWLTRPTPFGYLYTEDGELVVDFNSLRRAPLGNLMRRDRVAGAELDVPGFEGVSFNFGGGEQLSIESKQVSSTTVRVNNQPVTDSTSLHDHSFIGALGRLYMFRTQPQDA